MTAALEVERIEQLASSIDGWLTPAEGRLLYELARRADPRGGIVEIGSWKGRSTIWLAAGAKAGRGARVAAVDPHEGTSLHSEGESTEQALRRNLEAARVSDQVDVIRATSEEAATSWSRPVALLWIDGDHAYESVRRDFQLWEPYVVAGGVVALHDTLFWHGPGRVAAESLERSRRYAKLAWTDTITYATKHPAPTIGQRLGKRFAIAHRRLYRASMDNRFHRGDAFDHAWRLKHAVGRGIRRHPQQRS